MIYTIKQSVVREKNGTLNDIMYEGETLNCTSESTLKLALRGIEKSNPEWKRLKPPFIPKHHWAYIEITVYKGGKLEEAYYYYII